MKKCAVGLLGATCFGAAVAAYFRWYHQEDMLFCAIRGGQVALTIGFDICVGVVPDSNLQQLGGLQVKAIRVILVMVFFIAISVLAEVFLGRLWGGVR